ncbi:MAG: MFS transporter [Rikenellaceae bacterium]
MKCKERKERLFNRNYVLLSVASLLMFAGFYLVMPIIARYVVDEFHADSSVAGIVAASYIITALLTRPFSGYLVDRFDRRRFYLVAFALFAFLFTGYIISTSIVGLIITRVLLGATFALVTTAASTLAIDVIPSSRRGEGIGYYGAIIVLAMAVGPMVGLYFIEWFTYKELFILAASSCWVGVGIGSMVRTAPREKVVHKEPMSVDRFFLREGASVASVISLMYFFYGSLMVYVSLYVGERGIEGNSGNFFLLFACGILGSRVMAGGALRRGLNDLIVKLGALLIITSGALFASSLLDDTLFTITSVTLGLGFGLVAPSIQSMMIDLVPARRRGTANSTYFIALDLGSGVGMLVGGTIAHWWSYQALYVVAVALSVVALLFYLLYAKGDYNRRAEAAKREM